MKQMKHAVFLAFVAILGLSSVAPVAMAQGMFDPIVTVDDKAVTRYEVQQRVLLLRVLRSPGNLEELARTQLIEDRVKLAAARSAGIELSEEVIMDGMTEFASRANLSLEELIRALASAGVAEQTFRDFIISSLTWRDLVRARFVPRVRISEADIDKAIGAISGGSAVRVLLSEIILPAPPQQAAEAQALADRLSQINSVQQFSAEAGQVSASQSRANGGRLDWMPLTNLPAPLRPVILGLSVGQVTQPIPLEGAIALFQLRAIEESTMPPIICPVAGPRRTYNKPPPSAAASILAMIYMDWPRGSPRKHCSVWPRRPPICQTILRWSLPSSTVARFRRI